MTMDAADRRKQALEVLGVEAERQASVRHRPPRKIGTKLMPHEIGTRKQKYRMCESKKRYRSQSEAHRTANAIRQKRGTKLHCYYCGLCHGYHLTKRVRTSANSGRVF